MGVESEDGRRSFRFLVADDSRQGVVDALQSLLGAARNTRIIILPVDAALTRPPDEDEEGKKRKSIATTREELYSEIARGARLDSNFLLTIRSSSFLCQTRRRISGWAMVTS